MGCHAALNALRVAAGFTGADPEACVLLCAVELCSLHLQYGWEAERIVANALFADGAAALVASGEGAAAAVAATPVLRRWIASGSYLVPASAEAMSWAIEDHGFVMGLSPQVPDLIGAHLRPWLEGWLAVHHLTLESIGCWAVHPGGPRILSAVTETLGLDPTLIEPTSSHSNWTSKGGHVRGIAATCPRRPCCSSSSACGAVAPQVHAWRWHSARGSVSRWRRWSEKPPQPPLVTDVSAVEAGAAAVSVTTLGPW